MPKELLIKNIEYLRTINLFTFTDMDKLLGHNSRMYAHIKNGKAFPSTRVLKIISDKFKVSINYLCRTDISIIPKSTLTKNYNKIQALLKQN